MNFFEHQDQARKKTGHLVFFFILAVICLIALTNLLVVGVLGYLNGVPLINAPAAFDYFSLKTLLIISVVIVSVVVMASLTKLSQLSRGGKVIAEAMGGKLLNVSDLDKDERKALNIVEEMAIASGTPVPQVYLIEEPGINAFAAGYKPADAIIGVTRGCISQLKREELQGVIAHEFSHILHGDMRLNIRLMGILHGILVIGIIGSYILRGISRTGYRGRSSKNNNALPFFILGGGFMLIGYAGTFFGNLIKAAVSRQREFLADASAVQFTRNPSGISGALKKIGGFSSGSAIEHPYASEMSHLFFGQAIQPFFSALMATHPALDTRIKKIEPNWDGIFPKVEQKSAYGEVYTHKTANTGAEETMAFADETSVVQADTGFIPEYSSGYSADTHTKILSESVQSGLIDTIGEPSLGHEGYARHFLNELPAKVREAAHEPYGARALVYCMLLDENDDVRHKQWQVLRQNADQFVFSLMDKFTSHLVNYSKAEHRLSLLELCLPALKQLSEKQWQVFRANMVLLMKADGRVELFEWALYRITLHYLDADTKKLGQRGSIGSLRLVSKAAGLVLSAVASSGADNDDEAIESFNVAKSYLGLRRLKYSAPSQYQLRDLSQAVSLLNRLKPLLKPRVLKAMCLCVTHDGMIKADEVELVRALSASLDCPMPPLLLSKDVA